MDGTPLVGVNVSFAHHNDYGYTISRQDGRYKCYSGFSMLNTSFKMLISFIKPILSIEPVFMRLFIGMYQINII